MTAKPPVKKVRFMLCLINVLCYDNSYNNNYNYYYVYTLFNIVTLIFALR